MDRVLIRDIRNHFGDLYAVLACEEGSTNFLIVPLTKIADQGTFKINETYWLRMFGSLLMTSDELGSETTWVGELTPTELDAIAEAFQRQTKRERDQASM